MLVSSLLELLSNIFLFCFNKFIHNRGINIEIFEIRRKSQRFSKFVEVIPKIWIITPPNYLENKSPKVQVAIRTANIVPSMFFGQILHAMTRTGVMLISVIVYIKALSPNAKSLSGIPNCWFCLVTNKI